MVRLSVHTRREGFVIERLAMFIGLSEKRFVLFWHSTPVASMDDDENIDNYEKNVDLISNMMSISIWNSFTAVELFVLLAGE